MKKLFTLITLIYSCVGVLGQAGQLDSAFGTNGIVKTDVGSNLLYQFDSRGIQVLSKADGSTYIIISASNHTYIAKLLSDGSPDKSYGNQGFSTAAQIIPNKAALQSDGKIIIAGYIIVPSLPGSNTNIGNNFAVARFNIDGSLDSSFSNDGIQTTYLGTNNDDVATAVAIQSDGKIVVTGYADNGVNFSNRDIALVRYNADGSLDNTFNYNGRLISHFNLFGYTDDYDDDDIPTAIAIQPDGKIVVAGSVNLLYIYPAGGRASGIARYNNDGTDDLTFGNRGRKTFNGGAASDLAIQTDGKLIFSDVAPYTIARLNPDGNFDLTFANAGRATLNIAGLDYCKSLSLQSDNKIVVLGTSYNYNSPGIFIILRYNIDGTLDSTFDDDGVKSINVDVHNYASSVAIKADGKILAAGSSSATGYPNNYCVVSCNPDGTPDDTFDQDGILIRQVNLYLGATSYKCIAAQNDGKVVTAGTAWSGSDYDFAVTRYNPDGTLDSTFSSNGKTLISFGQGFSNDTANSILIQPDGKIVVAGKTLNGVSGNEDIAIARLNTDGSLDNTFSGDGILTSDFNGNDYANSVAIQADGKIIVGGSVNSNFAVIRYNTDGSIDNTFATGLQITTFFPGDPSYSATANAIVIQPDGKIIAVGTASIFNIYQRYNFALARYNTDGTLDKSFSNDGMQISDFGLSHRDFANSAAIQKDGKIMVAGSTLNATSEFGFVRYNQDGSIDSTFDDDGFQVSHFFQFWDEEGAANSISVQSDGTIIGAGIKKTNVGFSHAYFALVFLKTDGSFDSAYTPNGQQITDVGDYGSINGVTISGNRLYAAGYGIYQSNFGVVAKYLLKNTSSPLSCPSPVTLSNQKEKCSAVVSNIDPVLADATLPVNYALTGATTLNGAGSASGLAFNGGVTTVTYALANDPNATCSFNVNVNDSEAPRMTKIIALPDVLWPVTQKMRKVFLDYQTKDNCGVPSCKISVTGNQDVTGDWAMVSDHFVNLRATQDQGRERVYTVTVTCTDAAGNTTSRNVNVRVPGQRMYPNIDGGGAPLFDYAGTFGANAYPNPSNDYFRLHITSPDKVEKIAVKVYDISGRLMEEKNGIGAGEDVRIGAALGAGVYLVQILQGKNSGYTKLVKTARN